MPKLNEKELTMQINETLEIKEESTLQYKKEDCEQGFLTDPQEIEDYIRHQQIDILQNELLGDYAKDGEYYLPDEIRDELVKVPKVVTNNYENYIFAQTIIPIGEFGHGKFFVMVNKLDKQLIATLTFVEPIHKMNKLLTNAQSVQIASFIGDGGEKFFYDMKKEFNIVDDDYIMPDEDKKAVFKYSIKRKQYRKRLWKEALKDIEKTEKEIYNKRMEILKGLKNEYSIEVLKLFEEQLKKKGPFFNKAPNQYICLNQLLDECLGMVSGKHPKLETNAMKLMKKVIEPFVAEQDKVIKSIKMQIGLSFGKSSGTRIISREANTPTQNKEYEQNSIGDFGSILREIYVRNRNTQQRTAITDFGAGKALGASLPENNISSSFGGFGGFEKNNDGPSL